MKLIFLDIDGTLTPPASNTPPDSALQAIQQARANGHKVFLCTGRNAGMLAPVLTYGFDGAVASAGGYVFAGEQVLYDCPMTRVQFETGLRLLHEQGVLCTIEARDATWGDLDLKDFLASAGDGNSELLRWRRAIFEELGIRPMQDYDGRPIYKIVFMCREMAQLAPAREALEAEFNFVVQDLQAKGCLNGELINRKFDKGTGVRRIAEFFGARLEDTIGFGDSMNDREMIETVGTSVCMENGSPLLKELSDLVCPSVEADGILEGFRRLRLI